MLVLTRKTGQTLVIGNGDIKLTVLEVRGNQVRLGIEAPRDVTVHREEIYQRIQQKVVGEDEANDVDGNTGAA